MKTYKKIDLFEKTKDGYIYICTTSQSKSCKEAKAKYIYNTNTTKNIVANYQKKSCN